MDFEGEVNVAFFGIRPSSLTLYWGNEDCIRKHQIKVRLIYIKQKVLLKVEDGWSVCSSPCFSRHDSVSISLYVLHRSNFNLTWGGGFRQSTRWSSVYRYIAERMKTSGSSVQDHLGTKGDAMNPCCPLCNILG